VQRVPVPSSVPSGSNIMIGTGSLAAGVSRALKSAGLAAMMGLLLPMPGMASAEKSGMGEISIGGCPSSPNCVSSRSTDDAHYIRPLAFDTSPERAWEKLRAALTEEPRTLIVDEKPAERYLRAESTSFLFRFVDDLEFLMIPDEKVIQVRAASRVGHWDLGVNRRRVERLRQRFSGLLEMP